MLEVGFIGIARSPINLPEVSKPHFCKMYLSAVSFFPEKKINQFLS